MKPSINNSDLFVANSRKTKLVGRVIEVLPNTQFRVQLEGEETVLRCVLAGKMRMNHITVLLHDKVELEIPKSTMHLENNIGRITYRHK